MQSNDFTPDFGTVFRNPNETSDLWRYMDFAKFVSMLSSQGLWASSAASFEDPFEGAIGLYEDRPAYIMLQMEYAKQELEDYEVSDSKMIINKYRDIKKIVHETESQNLKRRKSTYINCWYESQYESMAMWRLFSNDNQNAIAIRSSYRRIKEALTDSIVADVGRVNYVDYSTPPEVLAYYPYWFKSFHFAHEKEVRIVPTIKPDNADSPPNGVLLPIDLNILIACIYVSPWAQPWLLTLVKDVCKKYGIEARVTESAIAQKPLY